MAGHGSVGARVATSIVLVGLLTALVPVGPVSAQAANEIVVSDDTGDVYLARPETGAAAPATTGLDIVEAKLFDVAGEAFQFRLKLADMNAAQGMPGQVNVGACFQWDGHPFGIRLAYSVNPVPSITGVRELGLLSAACDPTANMVFSTRQPGIPVALDGNQGTVTIMVSRSLMATLADAAPPAPGETVDGFRAFTFDSQRTRYDLAPNAGTAEGAMSFPTVTANSDLRASIDNNVAGGRECGGQPARGAYAIEAGGKRGVPIILENTLREERTAQLTVETVEGLDWAPALLPSIELPAATDVGTGNVTVNVIIDTPAGTTHKECATLRLRATDPASAGSLGEATFNVFAVSPPGPEAKKLYMHTVPTGVNLCNIDNFWLNTLVDDPDGTEGDVFLAPCREVSPVSASSVNLRLMLDVNPSHDLVLNTSAVGANAIVTVGLRSDGPPTTAKISALVMSGRAFINRLGEASVTTQITSTATAVRIEVPIDFTRDFVGTGDPSRIVEAREGIGVVISYEPDDSVTPVPVAGRVFLDASMTSLELPIWATIKRNVNDPGAGGSLLSISAAEGLPEFAAPGGLRLFNFTILNEGAQPDIAVVTATLASPAGWTAEIFPAEPIRLEPGQRGLVQVGVRPRADAAESERALLDVLVTSQVDPTARASISVPIIATKEQTGVDAVPFDAGAEKGGLPGLGLPVVLVGLVAVAAFVARRR